MPGAIRAASIAVAKQSPGVEAAMTGTGDSALRPKSTMSRSACSGFVGIPVEGPARWMSRMTAGLERDREADRLRLEDDARAARGGDAERAAEGSAERRADGGDLVLGLEGPHAEGLVPRELLEDPGRGRDRVGAEEERQLALHARRDQPHRERLVPGDVAVRARRELRGPHLVLDGELLGRLAEGIAGLERLDVRLRDVGAARELLLEEGDRALRR